MSADFEVFQTLFGEHVTPNRVVAVMDPLLSPSLSDILPYIEEWYVLSPHPQDLDSYNVFPHCLRLNRKTKDIESVVNKILSECGVLIQCSSSCTDMTALAGHLNTLANVILPDEQMGYFRYYDPYYLYAIIKTADDTQIQKIYGECVDTFICRSSDQDIGILKFPDNISRSMVDVFRITTRQYEYLYEIQYEEFIRSLYKDIISRGCTKYISHDTADALYEIRRLADSAGDYGCITRKQMYDFIYIGLSHGLDIYDMPHIKNELNKFTVPVNERIEKIRNIAVRNKTSAEGSLV